MKPKTSLRSFFALAGSSLLAITHAHAIDWIGGDSTWSTNTNWSTNVVPNATNHDVFFIGSSNQNITLDGSYTIRTLGFSNTGISNIRGNSSGTTARTLTSVGSITVNSGAGAVTIGDTPGTYGAVNIALGANNTWTNNSESLLTFTGTVTNNGTFTHTIGGSGNTAISGAINTGAVALTKTGFGTLTLSGANGYTGATFANGGKLVLDMNSGGSLNSASTLQVSAAAPAGTFEIKGKSGAFVSSQTMGNLTLGNNAYLKIVLDPNNGTGTTLTLGDAWAIGGPSALVIDYSSSNTGTRQVVTANATTSQTLLDGIYQKILVKDINGVTGFATRAAGSNQAITRYDDATLATTLTSAIPTSNTVNYTTLGAGASVTMTDVTRSINSLVVDTTNNTFALNTGANTLTMDTAILFRGSNNATISGGIINTQYIHQVGTGELTINNVITPPSNTVFGKTGAGTLVLGGNNTFTGAMNIHEGIVKLGAAGNGTQSPLGTTLGNTLVNVGGALDLNGITLSTAEALTLYGTGVANGGALTNSGANASYSGLLTISANASIIASGGDINLTNAGTTNIANGLIVGGAKNTSIAAILSGAVTATAPASLTKQDSGTLTLSGVNTYAGATRVNGGTLAVASTGTINSTAGVTIASGATFRYNSSTALTKSITNNGGTIGGIGDIGVSVALDSTSDILAPGNSPGIQEYTVAQSWDSFTYQWEVNDFDGTTAGTDYDQIQITGGGLTLNGAIAGSYILDLVSLAGLLNTAGNVVDFSETTTSWNILTASGGITGFNAAYWTIDDTGFTSSPAWGGTWSLSLNDTLGTDDLVLTYTAAIPEPRAALLGGLGLLMLLRRRRA